MPKEPYDFNKYHRTWYAENPDKVLVSRIRCAFRLLLKYGVIDREKVLDDPTI